MKLATKRLDQANPRAILENHDNFGFTDNRGRRIGIYSKLTAYRVQVFANEYGSGAHDLIEATPEGADVFVAFAQVTRNGTTYGAQPHHQKFATEEAARAWLAKRAKRCQRENYRKFAPFQKAVPFID